MEESEFKMFDKVWLHGKIHGTIVGIHYLTEEITDVYQYIVQPDEIEKVDASHLMLDELFYKKGE